MEHVFHAFEDSKRLRSFHDRYMPPVVRKSKMSFLGQRLENIFIGSAIGIWRFFISNIYSASTIRRGEGMTSPLGHIPCFPGKDSGTRPRCVESECTARVYRPFATVLTDLSRYMALLWRRSVRRKCRGYFCSLASCGLYMALRPKTRPSLCQS